MKKLYAYFMTALVAVFVLVACGNNNEPNQDQPDVPGNDTIVNNDTIENNDTIVTPPTFQELIIGSWLCDSCTITMGDQVQNGPMVGAEFTFDADGNLDLSGDAQTYTLQDSTIRFDDPEHGMATEYTIQELNETRFIFFKESGPARLTIYCIRKSEE